MAKGLNIDQLLAQIDSRMKEASAKETSLDDIFKKAEPAEPVEEVKTAQEEPKVEEVPVEENVAPEELPEDAAPVEEPAEPTEEPVEEVVEPAEPVEEPTEPVEEKVTSEDEEKVAEAIEMGKIAARVFMEEIQAMANNQPEENSGEEKTAGLNEAQNTIINKIIQNLRG